jgi:hypothetical protein
MNGAQDEYVDNSSIMHEIREKITSSTAALRAYFNASFQLFQGSTQFNESPSGSRRQFQSFARLEVLLAPQIEWNRSETKV